ncbi:hypothetical protein [Shewanella youngdeokensis]|uniref:Uncharacterized protein n=1 Tax=Shewanella youngdeokensis TaxID=2999068 RepID=A0ABZ0JYH3_9GAMM|nr:hypothetical protein RGE70_18410 [Shewanella sp. DAU334]
MKGWVLLVLIAGGIYYLYTETDTLDDPYADMQAIYEESQTKLQGMTGTQLKHIDDKVDIITTDIAERLSSTEQKALGLITQSQDKLEEYKEQFCGGGAEQHHSFSKENQMFICDHL